MTRTGASKTTFYLAFKKELNMDARQRRELKFLNVAHRLFLSYFIFYISSWFFYCYVVIIIILCFVSAAINIHNIHDFESHIRFLCVLYVCSAFF